jgi:hypothetical protein
VGADVQEVATAILRLIGTNSTSGLFGTATLRHVTQVLFSRASAATYPQVSLHTYNRAFSADRAGACLATRQDP